MEARREAASRLKWLWVVFVSLVTAGVSFGQQEAQDPAKMNLEILKLHWEKQVRLPRNFDPSIIPTGGTFNDPASRTSSTAGASVMSDATRAATRAQSVAAGSSDAFPATPGRLPVFYEYSMKIKNVGSGTIEGLAWDYLFIDPSNNAELGKHQFLSYARIPTDKSGTLRAEIRSPPTRVVRSSNSTKNAHPKLIEKSVIQCVLYADDTVWENPKARNGVCELLKNNKTLIKRRAG
jgi:hypothetical protein